MGTRENGSKFDVIVCDFAIRDNWQYMRAVLNESLCILSNDGYILNHCSSISSQSAPFQDLLSDISCKIKNTSDAFVPSFREKWVFFEINSVNTNKKEDLDKTEIQVIFIKKSNYLIYH